MLEGRVGLKGKGLGESGIQGEGPRKDEDPEVGPHLPILHGLAPKPSSLPPRTAHARAGCQALDSHWASVLSQVRYVYCLSQPEEVEHLYRGPTLQALLCGVGEFGQLC